MAAGAADLMTLRLLAAVAESGSISAAARTTGISQQAASARMRALEQRLGIPLLHRAARGTGLTPEGAIAAEWAADVAEAADRFEAGIAALRGRRAPLRVAASLTVAEYLLPRWLITARMGASATDREISVTATNSTQVIDLVSAGTHPLGFIESPQSIGALHATMVARDELVVVVAPDHDWAARRTIGLGALAGTPLISRERGSGTRLNAERMMAEAGHPAATPLVELPTTAAIRTAVESGAGAAILSILAVRDDIAAGRLVQVRVRELRFIRELRAVYGDASLRAPELQRLLTVAARGA
ncbi:MAG: LysR family transcriptional regulator [Microbacteriaceae bacterium]|nr:LysR family transcriptional regulator [Microbacteriaceae bacterium]MCL2795998.1 LysR family transcriptional regulator [Microbacteriaceae bacterium]